MIPPLIYRMTPAELAARAEARRLRGVFYVDHQDYHDGPGLSSTRVKRLLESPAHFQTPVKETDAMRFGTALHMAVLEPEIFAATYLCAPDVDRRTTYGKETWKDFQDNLPTGRPYQILTAAQWVQLAGMAQSLGRSAVFRGLIQSSVRELAAYAQCPETGVLRKAKSDIFSEDGIIADVKTCTSARPEDFWRTVLDYGYHTSAAWYLDVFSDALRTEVKTFIWIAIEKVPPYAIGFYVADEKVLQIGRDQCKKAVEIYRNCEKTGEWPGYPDEVTLLEFPDYILRRYA